MKYLWAILKGFTLGLVLCLFLWVLLRGGRKQVDDNKWHPPTYTVGGVTI